MTPSTSRLLLPTLLLGFTLPLTALTGCSAGDAPNSSEGAAGAPPAMSGDRVSGDTLAESGALAPVEPRSDDVPPAEAAAPTETAPQGMAPNETETMTNEGRDTPPADEVATLGAGCFWCIEAVLEQVEGVKSVESGYTGGQTENPTYKDICTGRTGHAEVVRVTFDPTVLSYAELLDWFWRLHDPTTLNRQGNDRGTQYRSAIFYHSEEQRKIAETSKRDVQPTFDDPIVTEVTEAAVFYPAEQYHQGYYFDNTSQGYCQMVIAPKLKKLGLKY